MNGRIKKFNTINAQRTAVEQDYEEKVFFLRMSVSDGGDRNEIKSQKSNTAATTQVKPHKFCGTHNVCSLVDTSLIAQHFAFYMFLAIVHVHDQ